MGSPVVQQNVIRALGNSLTKGHDAGSAQRVAGTMWLVAVDR